MIRPTFRTAVAVLIAIFLTAAAVSVAQEPTPAEQRLRQLVDTLNSGDTERITAFVSEAMGAEMRDSFPMEEHLAILGGFHERHGELTIHEIEASSDHRLQALLHGAGSDAWLTAFLGVAEDDPHLIEGIGFQPADAPGSVPEVESLDDLPAALDQYISGLVADERFSGAVLVATKDGVVFQGAWGEANRDFGAANRIDTKFNLGSMNKMFTAVAIAQLVEQGKMAFDDPLSKFLPEFPDPESAAKIRIEHLLTHTSGLGSYFNEEFMRGARSRFRSVDDFMELAEGETLQAEPGTNWFYSNTGFLVLGKVIEVVSGLDYHEYIRRYVTGRAGMRNTDAYELDRVNPNLAVGYERVTEDGETFWRNNIFDHVIRGGPAGGGYSTVEDLLLFAHALQDGTLVSREMFRTLTTPKPELGSDGYGFGFGIQQDGSVGHSGGFTGINSNLSMWPDGRVAVVMSNVSGGAMPIVRRISEWFGRP